MNRSLRPPLIVYSTDHSGCSLIALLAALTSALFLQVWGWIRRHWWVSLVFLLLGMAALFRRRAVVIDPANRKVTLIRRWLVTTRKTVSIDQISVRLDPEPESGQRAVWLDAADGSSFRFELTSADDPREAAERLAADLGRPLSVRGS